MAGSWATPRPFFELDVPVHLYRRCQPVSESPQIQFHTDWMNHKIRDMQHVPFASNEEYGHHELLGVAYLDFSAIVLNAFGVEVIRTDGDKSSQGDGLADAAAKARSHPWKAQAPDKRTVDVDIGYKWYRYRSSYAHIER